MAPPRARAAACQARRGRWRRQPRASPSRGAASAATPPSSGWASAQRCEGIAASTSHLSGKNVYSTEVLRSAPFGEVREQQLFASPGRPHLCQVGNGVRPPMRPPACATAAHLLLGTSAAPWRSARRGGVRASRHARALTPPATCVGCARRVDGDRALPLSALRRRCSPRSPRSRHRSRVAERAAGRRRRRFRRGAAACRQPTICCWQRRARRQCRLRASSSNPTAPPPAVTLAAPRHPLAASAPPTLPPTLSRAFGSNEGGAASAAMPSKAVEAARDTSSVSSAPPTPRPYDEHPQPACSRRCTHSAVSDAGDAQRRGWPRARH